MNAHKSIIVTIEKQRSRLVALDNSGKDWTSEIYFNTRKNAYNSNMALERTIGKNNKVFWRRVSLDLFDIPVIPITDESIEAPEGHKEIVDFIHDSYSLKPKGLAMTELKWKYLVRSAVRGKNILMTGPAGCGKTMAAKSLVHALDRPDFYFNLGATQDPRSTLIGNTHFDNETGTYFSKALFVKAISTPNAIILLDELSRAHPDAWNILMTVLDEGQRYLRLDEADGSETINVAEGVTFVATANIGNEYTSTRVMDKALMDRFIIVEMDVLDAEEEHGLLKYMFPHINDELLQPVAEIAHLTRIESLSESGKITSGVSTRTSVEVSGLLFDGFKLAHAAEVCIYPQYSNDGGVESERTYIKQLVQKYISDGSSDDLFNEDEIQRSNEGTSS